MVTEEVKREGRIMVGICSWMMRRNFLRAPKADQARVCIGSKCFRPSPRWREGLAGLTKSCCLEKHDSGMVEKIVGLCNGLVRSQPSNISTPRYLSSRYMALAIPNILRIQPYRINKQTRYEIRIHVLAAAWSLVSSLIRVYLLLVEM